MPVQNRQHTQFAGEPRVLREFAQEHPLAPFILAPVASWLATAIIITLLVRVGDGDTLLALWCSLLLVLWSSLSTLITLWCYNEVATIRSRARREHPSYPYRSR